MTRVLDLISPSIIRELDPKSMKFLVFLVASIVAIVTSSPSGIDWCKVKAETCKPGDNHIACAPNGFEPSETVNNLKSISLSQAQKNGIIRQHNTFRNAVAAGTYGRLGYPPATKMGEMKWDRTLEYLASLHASYGLMAHDECRSTRKFPYSGQSLYYTSSHPHSINISDATISAGEDWFSEINLADMSGLVDKYIHDYHEPAGHFAVMVNDLNNRIGCAASTMDYVKDGVTWHGLLLTCNYEYTNMEYTPTYIKGPPLKDCETPASKTYRNLCSASN